MTPAYLAYLRAIVAAETAARTARTERAYRVALARLEAAREAARPLTAAAVRGVL